VGKTYVLNQYIDYLHKNNIPVGITASTGIAATHLNGTTIHSWSGIGIKDKLSKTDIKKLLTKKYLKNHFLHTSVLIIDEISMLHAHQLDMINQLAQIFRKDLRPFGGMQIILCGDFFQLPPVAQDNQVSKFIFDSEIWQAMKFRICYLQEQHRQDDPDFLNILNQIRSGQVNQSGLQLLNSRINSKINTNLKVTKLYTHNIDVDSINSNELTKISGKYQEYEMNFRGNRNLVEVLKKSCLAPEILQLKIGASVMFVKNNFELGIVNGTLGKIIAFDEFNYPIVKIKTGEEICAEQEVWTIDENGHVLAQIKQIPLRLAWAITVHKSQGMSLDFAEVDLRKSFQPGMGYVALSRVRNLAGLKLNGFNEMALQVDQQILVFDKSLQNISSRTAELLNELVTKKIVDRQEKFVLENENKMPKKIKKKANKLITLDLIHKKMSLEKIAQEQGLKLNTIINHIEKMLLDNIKMDLKYLKSENNLDDKKYNKIKLAFEKCGLEKLKPVFDELQEEYDYDDLRLVRLILMAEDSKTKVPF